MSQQQINVSLPQVLAQYVSSAPDADLLAAQALHTHRKQNAELARAYQEDAEESRQLHAEWSPADAELPE